MTFRLWLTRMAALCGAALCLGMCACGTGPGRPGPVSSPAVPAAVTTDGPSLATAAQFQSPEAATVSWFYAINHRDKAAARAHFTPAAAPMMNWYGTWPSFSSLRCRPASLAGPTATVYCSFTETPGADGNIDTFWTVHLRRQPDSRWLIDNYGQG